MLFTRFFTGGGERSIGSKNAFCYKYTLFILQGTKKRKETTITHNSKQAKRQERKADEKETERKKKRTYRPPASLNTPA